MRDWEREEKARLKKSIAEDTYADENGALFWKASDNPVPAWTFKDAGVEPPAAQAAADRKHLDAFLVSYKRSQANRTPEQLAEERFEARAAHGPGVELVNVLTGEKYTT